ncbi:MAG: MazG nucleotide pyrophosphohydrolase domain-containing protein [Candidatus Altiarchaeota archaeon]
MYAEAQKQVREYDRRFGWDSDRASHIALHIQEELGEVARRVLRDEGYKKERFDKGELAQELTDILYLTLKLANKYDIDLDSEWELMWNRFKKKTSRL